MIEKRKAGKPSRGTISLDEVILRRLRDGPATWGELMDAMPPGSARNDSSLKNAIDRLREDKMLIMPDAILKNGKGKTIYRLVKPHGVMLDFYQELHPLYKWVGETHTELFEKKLAWHREINKNNDSKFSRDHEKSITVTNEIIERQGEAIAVALQGLTEEILDFIKTSYELNEGSEGKRRAYLETAWDDYLSMIAIEISGLAAPELGDTGKSIQIAKEKLKNANFD